MTIEPPKFIPKPGQIDYTGIRWAPVINCLVKFKDKILLVRRNKNMNLYPGVWNGISGFLDDDKSLEEKVREELQEELGLHSKDIKSIHLGEIFDQEEPKYQKTWIVHPVLVDVTSDKIRLDWEAQEYQWVTPEEIDKLETLPGFDRVAKSLLKNRWLQKETRSR
ncbi:MAG TPA: NUDIX domain-containing protein [Candidatus Paceibacterota bacterium]